MGTDLCLEDHHSQPQHHRVVAPVAFRPPANADNAADSFDANTDGESNLLEFATAQSLSTLIPQGTSGRRFTRLRVSTP